MEDIITGRRPLTAQEAIDILRAGVPAGADVMAQNYDPDCPNFEDHGPNGECECWDGLTLDDVETFLETDGVTVDVENFAEWGPFEYWTYEAVQP